MKKIIYLSFLLLVALGCDQSGDSMSYKDSADPGNETGKGGSLARFTISRDYLYTVDNSTLKYFDLANAADPVYAGSTYAGFNIETIFSRDSVLFLGTQTGMTIYDISIPSSPQYMSNFQHIKSCDPVVADSRYAYVTLNSGSTRCWRTTNELQVVDLNNLFYPILVKSYPMSTPKGLGIDNKTLFVCDNGLKVYDASDVRNLKLTKHFNIKANDVIPYNNLLIVVGDDGLYQYKYENDTITFLSKMSIN